MGISGPKLNMRQRSLHTTTSPSPVTACKLTVYSLLQAFTSASLTALPGWLLKLE